MASQGDDCYFFYYSSCAKGDSCPFRHQPAAFGSEIVCDLWQQGTCFRPICHLRHMVLDKSRTSIPCYWEGQESGCLKSHCPFTHSKPRQLNNVTMVTPLESYTLPPVQFRFQNAAAPIRLPGVELPSAHLANQRMPFHRLPPHRLPPHRVSFDYGQDQRAGIPCSGRMQPGSNFQVSLRLFQEQFATADAGRVQPFQRATENNHTRKRRHERPPRESSAKPTEAPMGREHPSPDQKLEVQQHPQAMSDTAAGQEKSDANDAVPVKSYEEILREKALRKMYERRQQQRQQQQEQQPSACASRAGCDAVSCDVPPSIRPRNTSSTTSSSSTKDGGSTKPDTVPVQSVSQASPKDAVATNAVEVIKIKSFEEIMIEKRTRTGRPPPFAAAAPTTENSEAPKETSSKPTLEPAIDAESAHENELKTATAENATHKDAVAVSVVANPVKVSLPQTSAGVGVKPFEEVMKEKRQRMGNDADAESDQRQTEATTLATTVAKDALWPPVKSERCVLERPARVQRRRLKRPTTVGRLRREDPVQESPVAVAEQRNEGNDVVCALPKEQPQNAPRSPPDAASAQHVDSSITNQAQQPKHSPRQQPKGFCAAATDDDRSEAVAEVDAVACHRGANGVAADDDLADSDGEFDLDLLGEDSLDAAEHNDTALSDDELLREIEDMINS